MGETLVGGEIREKEWAMLMRAAMAGDAACYQQLLRSLAPTLRAAARRGLAHAGMAETDAEDVVQEILLAVHLKRQTWEKTAPFSPWLWAIARHKIIDALRRRGRRVDLPIEDFAESLKQDEAEPNMLVSDVNRHLDELPPGQRNVVRIVAVDGASIDEAAGRLAMTKGAVRVALHRGLAALAVKFRMADA
ncbi:sigma-70 family RNA polymerase sigma factor [Methylocapsa acidiphila]|uniref:sigma-70 family RNA polymerase sigma factor n=1 Tax=Methylocapsa acidiphila TaxID=133552 RepID=UPI00047D8587|nr:sigma-70 family RNA polymerase sigma factor [Methylocapsa acidiphila]